MLKCADGWRHMSPALNLKYCSKLARILWWGRGGCRQTPVWSPANARILPNAVSILAHRQRRWTNIETTLGQVFVFAGRAVRILIHACRLCLVGTGCTVLCVTTLLRRSSQQCRVPSGSVTFHHLPLGTDRTRVNSYIDSYIPVYTIHAK